jgi:hypothetical protein
MRRKSGLQLPRNMISWDAGDQHVYVVQGAADRGDCGADSRDCFTHLLSTNCVNSKAQKLPPPFPLLSNTFLLESIIREKYRLRRICTSLGVESSRIVTLRPLQIAECTPESNECFIEDQAFSLSYYLAPPHPPPLSRQQVVSLSQSSCVPTVDCTDGRGG